jgi:Xaa-Pro aminopeptidase
LPRLIKEKAYLPFFNHRTGHWLGSMCMMSATTRWAENGEFSSPEWRSPSNPVSTFARRPRAHQEFWNIGIRIEDDVLVTNGAPEVLTAAIWRKLRRLSSAWCGG